MREYKKVYGYVLDRNGMHYGKQLMDGSLESISDFIVSHPNNDCVITDVNDEFILSSMFGFIDRCPDKEFLEALRDVIIPKQTMEEMYME